MEQKNFYKTFFRIYIALVLQQMISLSVNLADNVMLGAYSETALSGVAAINQIQFIFHQIVNALGDGIVILGSQYWGKKQIEPVKKVIAIAMRLAVMVSLVLFVLVSIFPIQAVSIFTTDSVIIAQGTEYLKIIRFTYLIFAVTMILLASLRTVEIVNIAFYLSISTLVINCGINYVLIYGRFGAPQMGAAGAAIGTLTARIVECIVVIWYVWKKEDKLQIKLKDFAVINKELNKDYYKVTFPIVLIQGLWGANTAMQTVILGHMTASAIAANSVASNLYMMMKAMAIGAASTASIMIGKAIGMGNMKIVELYSKRLQKIFVVIGVAAGIILYFVRTPILNLYELSDVTREMADTFLVILSVIIVFMSYQMATNTGIVRGGGSSLFVMKVDIISIWGIVIPLSLFMAFVVKASPIVVVCCLNADQVFKCIPAFIKVNYGHWAKKLTRT